MKESFSENGDGLNHWGTEKVPFIDYFPKDYEIDLEHCAHQLVTLGDTVKWKSKKKITKVILLTWKMFLVQTT